MEFEDYKYLNNTPVEEEKRRRRLEQEAFCKRMDVRFLKFFQHIDTESNFQRLMKNIGYLLYRGLLWFYAYAPMWLKVALLTIIDH